MAKKEKFLKLAEKIVNGIASFMYEEDKRLFCESDKKTMIKAVRETLKGLTYGNLGTMTLRDNNGQIVAKLYILPDGTLADDSWTKHGR